MQTTLDCSVLALHITHHVTAAGANFEGRLAVFG